ncbi:MAG: hypothetical protein KGL12_13565 [Rhodospirillales bacterium]|nr:hypothetical protein [Rhodospirillales bacterium]
MSGVAGVVIATGFAGALMMSWVGPVNGQSPAVVTTDTPEYCLRLLDHVSELVRAAPPPPPAEAVMLSAEGQRMCNQGQTRGGIMRLRRALMILQPPASLAH